MCTRTEIHWFAHRLALLFHPVIRGRISVQMNWIFCKNKKTPARFPRLKSWQMIKHDSDACMSYRLPSVMTNITSMQRSMKDDRLGYLNLHSISKLHCSLPPQDVFSEFTWWNAACGLAPQPCWPTWLTVHLCHFNKRALAFKRSPGVLKCHLSDFIDAVFALTHAIVKHL